MRRGESWGLNNTNEKHAIISAALSADDTHVQTLHTTDKRKMMSNLVQMFVVCLVYLLG